MTERESKEKLLERIQERRAAARKKLKKRAIKALIGLGIIAVVLAILYPTLQVYWHTSKARSDDADTRKASLTWLADNEVKSAVPVFLEALNSAGGESDIARDALLKLADRSVIPELLKLWKDSSAKTRGRYNALEVLSVLGDRSLMDIFIDPLAVLSDRWEFSWDFLGKHADSKTVEKLLARLDSKSEREVKAAVISLGYIRKKPLVRDNAKARKALAEKLSSPVPAIRAEAAHALEGIAGREELAQLLAALDDKDEVVCQYATRTVGYMEPEVAREALGKLVELLMHELGNICREAADALIRIGAKPVLRRLIEIASDDEMDSYSRVSAIGVIRSIPGEESLEAITATLAAKDPLVAEAAAATLIRIGDAGSVGPLVETLKASTSHDVRVMAACALGMFGDRRANPALVAALKEGNIDLSKRAGEALLRIGAREVATELERIVLDTDIAAVARREALLVLSELRTHPSLKISLAALVDSEIGIREEAKNAVIQLTGDLLSKKDTGLEAARSEFVQRASDMYQEKMGAKLAGDLKRSKTFEEMNLMVLAAQRKIDDKNKADLDGLKAAMEKARGLYWTALLRDELAAAGVTQKEAAAVATSLRTFVERDYWVEEIPVVADINRVKEYLKQFGFQEEK
jgi:HEAT repeat protein